MQILDCILEIGEWSPKSVFVCITRLVRKVYGKGEKGYERTNVDEWR